VPKITFAGEGQTKIPAGFVSWSPDGTKIATLSAYGGLLTVQDAAGRVEQEKKFPSLPSPYSPFVVSNAQKIIFSPDAKTDVAFSVVDVASGRAVFQEHLSQPHKPGLGGTTFVLSPDGSVLAAVQYNIPGRPISLYDTNTWQKLSTIETAAAQGGVGRLALSADGSKLAFASSGKFFVFDARTGRPITITTLAVRVGGFAFSPDATMVAVEEIATDPVFVVKGLRIFRLADGTPIASHAPPYRGPDCPENREDCGLSSPILWAPSGGFLVFPDGYHTIRIWSPFAGNGEDATIQTRYSEGRIALSPDGSRLAVVNLDFVSIFRVGG